MLLAEKIMRVTFHDAVESIRGMPRAKMIVRFCYYNAEGKRIKVKARKASALYRDWYGECNICPANDAIITRLHILMNPTCTALDITEDVTFEQLMDAIEEVTVGFKPETNMGGQIEYD